MIFRNYASRALRKALRSRVSAAFSAMAGGVDPRTAFARTKVFYRSGAGEWARSLT